jgi:hypothetical protein
MEGSRNQRTLIKKQYVKLQVGIRQSTLHAQTLPISVQQIQVALAEYEVVQATMEGSHNQTILIKRQYVKLLAETLEPKAHVLTPVAALLLIQVVALLIQVAALLLIQMVALLIQVASQDLSNYLLAVFLERSYS